MLIQKYCSAVFLRSYSSLVVSKSASDSVPIVKIPAYVKVHIEKTKLKVKRKQLQKVTLTGFKGNTKFPIISSNNKMLNFYLGQRFDSRFPVPLVSKHWMKKSTSGQKFMIHKTSSDFLWKTKTGDVENLPSEFSEFNLDEKILEVIKANKFQNPSPIQARTIPMILELKNVLCVAETGSGKTMTYVIPILQHLVRAKAKLTEILPNSPLAIVVVPGRELAEQIGLEAFNICEPCGVDVRVLVPGGVKYCHLIPKNSENVDLLVATFGTLKHLIKKEIIFTSRLCHLVLDEADTLLDDSFIEEILRFLQFAMNNNCPHDISAAVQLILVSAIYPSKIDEIRELLPREVIEKVVLPHVHFLLSNISHKFLRLRDSHRAGVLLQHVKEDVQKHAPVMIFSNQSPCCDWMNGFLNENKVKSAKLHAGMTARQRAQAFFAFQEGEIDVLCCTDVASRGLDTQRVKHVINFDFPNNMSDYIQRSGRVGRLGSNHGHVTNFITTVPGAAVTQDIERSVRNSTGLPNVNSNIKGKLIRMYRKFK